MRFEGMSSPSPCPEDGSFYQKNPDFTAIYTSKDGKVSEKAASATKHQYQDDHGSSTGRSPRNTGRGASGTGEKGPLMRMASCALDFLMVLRFIVGCPTALVLATLMYSCFGCSGLILGMCLLLFKTRAAA